MISRSESEPRPIEQCARIDNGFWDIEDLSKYLKVKIKTLYAMTHDIPHYRVGKLIRFRKQEIDSWMENKRFKGLNPINKSRNRICRRIETGHVHIDKLIRNAIDQNKNESYIIGHGKSDRIEGP
jgi:excisionase family DNA binding protein